MNDWQHFSVKGVIYLVQECVLAHKTQSDYILSRSPAQYPPGFLDPSTDAREVLATGFFAGIDPVRSKSRKKSMPYHKERPSLAAKCYMHCYI